MLCGDLNGKEIQKRGDICICIADSLCCTTETNSTLWSNYTPVKIKKKNKENGATWDLTQPLNRAKMAITSMCMETTDWKLPGALTGLLGLSQCIRQPASGTDSSPSCSGTDLHCGGGCHCQGECAHLEETEAAQTWPTGLLLQSLGPWTLLW